jgi:hypothetical protein
VLGRKKAWGVMTRRGFTSADAPPQPAKKLAPAPTREPAKV